MEKSPQPQRLLTRRMIADIRQLPLRFYEKQVCSDDGETHTLFFVQEDENLALHQIAEAQRIGLKLNRKQQQLLEVFASRKVD